MHETAVVDADVCIGRGVKIWHWTHVSEAVTIGANSVLGQNVYVAPRVKIGAGVKIQNNVSIFQGVKLCDQVFIGPSVVFTNVSNPRAFIERKSEFKETLVAKGASVGANATIVCGNQLGQYCFIGAGAVVTRPIPNFAVFAGNPARHIGWVSKEGEKLDFESGNTALCSRSGDKYLLKSGQVELLTE